MAISIRRQTPELQQVVGGALRNKPRIIALEAGCGSASHVDLGTSVHLVGIDISERQLERNTLLGERILGDIQNYPLAANSFDVVICWEVLEHVSQPGRALANLVQAAREDGIIIIALPNVLSVKGLIAKLTPYWFHIWVSRRWLGKKDAGKDDMGPFPTVLRLSMAPNGVFRFAREHGLVVEYFHIFEGGKQEKLRRRFGIVGPVWDLVKLSVNALSLGKISADKTDFVLVLRKQARSEMEL